MSDRDTRLLAMRPHVPAETRADDPMESFQSLTLRPILMLQTPLILALMSIYLSKYCPHFEEFSHDRKRTFVRDILRRDSRPKHMLVGMVTGHFTHEEFDFFCNHEAEVRRRLVELCIQRLQEQMGKMDQISPQNGGEATA